MRESYNCEFNKFHLNNNKKYYVNCIKMIINNSGLLYGYNKMNEYTFNNNIMNEYKINNNTDNDEDDNLPEFKTDLNIIFVLLKFSWCNKLDYENAFVEFEQFIKILKYFNIDDKIFLLFINNNKIIKHKYDKKNIYIINFYLQQITNKLMIDLELAILQKIISNENLFFMNYEQNEFLQKDINGAFNIKLNKLENYFIPT